MGPPTFSGSAAIWALLRLAAEWAPVPAQRALGDRTIDPLESRREQSVSNPRDRTADGLR